MKFQYLDRHTLSYELHTKMAHPYRVTVIANRLQRVTRRWVDWLTSTDDIHIRKAVRLGEVAWIIFDRRTQTYTARTSEAEMRSHLDRT